MYIFNMILMWGGDNIVTCWLISVHNCLPFFRVWSSECFWNWRQSHKCLSHVIKKNGEICFSLFPSPPCFRTDWQKLRMFHELLPEICVTSAGLISSDSLGKIFTVCSLNLKFRVCVRSWHAICLSEFSNCGSKQARGILLFSH